MISRQSTPFPGRSLRKYMYLMLFLLTFLSLVAIIGSLGRLEVLQQPLMLILVSLAAFRGGRAIAYNFIFDWLRAPFTQVVPDSSGAGDSIQASGEGLRRTLGELLCCPICASTWVALVLSGLLILMYPIGIMLTFVLAAAGGSEVLHWRAERDEWQGRAAREESGSAWLSKKEGLFQAARKRDGSA